MQKKVQGGWVGGEYGSEEGRVKGGGFRMEKCVWGVESGRGSGWMWTKK